jgi:serine/threonine protein kinase
MAPEQCRAMPVDARTDLYACGVLLYRMMTGRVPFEGAHPLELCQRHLGEAPRPPRDIAPWVAPEIETIILKALQKAPADRYQTATELRDALLSTVAALEVQTGSEDTESFSIDAIVPGSLPEPATLIYVKPSDEGGALADTLEVEPIAPPPVQAAAPVQSRRAARRARMDARRLAFYAVCSPRAWAA